MSGSSHSYRSGGRAVATAPPGAQWREIPLFGPTTRSNQSLLWHHRVHAHMCLSGLEPTKLLKRGGDSH
ncbi:hypothetical protein RHMOL_Rhmol04G0159300 [Rhododendron molle]|uniref:Uncharacterized protein n=1 Tax=Rhododendron molle TaxID=49168 RepID=A0ACC0P1A6_RHOML|nr:hypothetical protein RHMOL_Rhmol04G0159300 [Rhododendron molle]